MVCSEGEDFVILSSRGQGCDDDEWVADDTKISLRGTVDISPYSCIRADDEIERRYVLKLAAQGLRTYFFIADDEASMLQWAKAFGAGAEATSHITVCLAFPYLTHEIANQSAESQQPVPEIASQEPPAQAVEPPPPPPPKPQPPPKATAADSSQDFQHAEDAGAPSSSDLTAQLANAKSRLGKPRSGTSAHLGEIPEAEAANDDFSSQVASARARLGKTKSQQIPHREVQAALEGALRLPSLIALAQAGGEVVQGQSSVVEKRAV